jgi:hypothetical protein
MIVLWTKQFATASGLFALLLITFSFVMTEKEKQLAQNNLGKASRTAEIRTASLKNLN